MHADREHQLTEIFRRVFHQPNLVLRDDLTAKDVPGWDSLNHVTLMIEVEARFGLRFTSSEVQNLARVGDLKALIERKLP